jgi:hypothetical protein
MREEIKNAMMSFLLCVSEGVRFFCMWMGREVAKRREVYNIYKKSRKFKKKRKRHSDKKQKEFGNRKKRKHALTVGK